VGGVAATTAFIIALDRVNGFSSGDLEAGAKYSPKGLYRAIVEPRPGDTPGQRLR
jgi:hypothetical protein